MSSLAFPSTTSEFARLANYYATYATGASGWLMLTPLTNLCLQSKPLMEAKRSCFVEADCIAYGSVEKSQNDNLSILGYKYG